MFGGAYLLYEICKSLGRFRRLLCGLFPYVALLVYGLIGTGAFQLWKDNPHAAGTVAATAGVVERVWSPVGRVLSAETPEVARRAAFALRACSADFVALSGWSIHRWAGVAPGLCGRSGAVAFKAIPAVAIDAGHAAGRQASVLIQEARFGATSRPEPTGPVWNHGWQR